MVRKSRREGDTKGTSSVLDGSTVVICGREPWLQPWWLLLLVAVRAL